MKYVEKDVQKIEHKRWIDLTREEHDHIFKALRKNRPELKGNKLIAITFYTDKDDRTDWYNVRIT